MAGHHSKPLIDIIYEACKISHMFTFDHVHIKDTIEKAMVLTHLQTGTGEDQCFGIKEVWVCFLLSALWPLDKLFLHFKSQSPVINKWI